MAVNGVGTGTGVVDSPQVDTTTATKTQDQAGAQPPSSATHPTGGNTPGAGSPAQQNKIMNVLAGKGLQIGGSKFDPKFSVGKDGAGFDLSKKSEAGKVGGAPVEKTTSGGVSFNPSENSGSGSFGKSFGSEIKNSKGWGVSFEAGADSKVSAGQKTEDGVTKFSVSADVSVKAKVGVSAPVASVSVEQTYGFKANYEVKMPEEAAKKVNPATVNPFDASSMPTGTTATLDGSHYSSTELNATFRHLAMQTNVTDEKGVSLSVEKSGDHEVTVTAGPTEAVKAYNGVGVDAGKVGKLMVGREDKIDGSNLRRATFDLSTPQGAAAYNDLLANGNLPRTNGNGVSGVSSIDKVGFSSQSQLKASLGPFATSLDGPKNTAASETVKSPDGTAKRTTDIQYAGNVPWTVTSSFDKNGREVPGSRTYSAKIQVDGNTGQLLGKATNTNVPRDAKEVSVTFTQDQMTRLMQQAQATSGTQPGNSDVGNLTRDYYGKFVSDTGSFAQALMRNLGGSDYGMAARLFQISNVTHQPIDATIKP